MIRMLGNPRRMSSHFFSASITPYVSCSYVKYAHWALVNFLDINPAGCMVVQSSPWPKYAPHPDGHVSHTTQAGFALVQSIGLSVNFWLAIILIISKHLSWTPHHTNGRPFEHIPDSGVVYVDTRGRNRDIYSISPRKHCTSWYVAGVGQFRISSNLLVEACSLYSSW